MLKAQQLGPLGMRWLADSNSCEVVVLAGI